MGSRLHFAGVRFKNCGAGLYPDHFQGPYDRDIPSSRGRIAFQRRCVLLLFPLWLLVGFSIAARINTRILRMIFKKLRPKEAVNGDEHHESGGKNN